MADILTEREVLVDVLALYKDFPCLWDTSHELYCNRDARNRALQIPRDCHSRFDRSITVNDVKKKIENMRAAYRQVSAWLVTAAAL
ncbi:unnamed protein product [Pieris macdunnoughi]|uniref:MADF domain-containing protein n=1 Tax=Pieris macdunnoughi TaxID=345717 RepID=A0A821XMZ1_9NEOP|nr:unnamed protein product [Pieris macdunnoughi]